MKKNFFDILQVSTNASTKEIKHAFRKLAMKYHPDTNRDIGSDEKFKEINEAYETLKSSETRDRYKSDNTVIDYGHFDPFSTFTSFFQQTKAFDFPSDQDFSDSSNDELWGTENTDFSLDYLNPILKKEVSHLFHLLSRGLEIDDKSKRYLVEYLKVGANEYSNYVLKNFALKVFNYEWWLRSRSFFDIHINYEIDFEKMHNGENVIIEIPVYSMCLQCESSSYSFCEFCKSNKYLVNIKKYEVAIPPLKTKRETLFFEGKGNNSLTWSGDLFITVCVVNKPKNKRNIIPTYPLDRTYKHNVLWFKN